MKSYLLRHADAGDRGDWTPDDRLRPLSEKGRRQAAALVGLLRDAAIGRVLSSPYLRCVQTVEPLAASRGLSVEPEPLLAEGSDWRATMELVAAAGAPLVLCSQGDVIGDLVADLVARGLVRPQDARAQKASAWILDSDGGAVRAARYLPPPVDAGPPN